MKTMKLYLVLFLLLPFALTRTAFADDSDTLSGMADYMSEISSSGSGSTLPGDFVLGAGGSSSSDSGIHAPTDGPPGGESLGGDLVSSVTDSVSGFGGDMIGGASGDMAGGLAEGLTGSLVGGGILGDMASGYVGDLVNDAVSGYVGDAVSGLLGDAILSIPEIGSLQGTIDGLASSLKSAVIGPNIPHYRLLWMFSGESVVNEVKSLFNGDFSNIEQGINNLKELF